jgi:hypothetical protein
MVISAISILFFRTTICHSVDPPVLRWFFGSLLAFLAYSNRSYEVICAVEILSYMVPFLLLSSDQALFSTLFFWRRTVPAKRVPFQDTRLVRIVLIAMSAILCLVICHLTGNGVLLRFLDMMTPTFVKDGLALLFPVHEIQAAYNILDDFVHEEGLLREQVALLFFITFHIQIGIGYLGIDFLKREQERRNQLVRMDMGHHSDDDDEDDDDQQTKKPTRPKSQERQKLENEQKEKMVKKSQKFQRTAAPFIFFTAVPYMVRVIGYGNLNALAFACFKDDVHRTIRLHDLFDHDNNLVALAEHSAKAPAGMCTKYLVSSRMLRYTRFLTL